VELLRAKDAADNVDPTPDSRTFTVDTTGPVAKIVAGPKVRTTNPFPTFEFTSEPNTLFTCSVDGVAVGCASPYETDRLSIGSHTFEVFGTDQAGNAGPPATRTFRYVRPLQTRILSSSISNGSAKFRFTGSGGLAPLGFQCRLTAARTTPAQRAWSVCQSRGHTGT
jgi:large repetitive protein